MSLCCVTLRLFVFPDKDVIEHHVMTGGERQSEQEATIEKETDKLMEEISNHDDIVFVSVTDVYRNIPHKLLKFYTWWVS